MSEDKLEAVQKSEKSPKARPPESRSELVRAVTSPLNFFSLVVMVVEAALGATALLGKLSEPHLFDVVLIMSGILAALIGTVGFITYTRPRHLSPEMAEALEKSDEALALSQQAQKYLSKKAFRDAVRDIIQEEKEADASTLLIERKDKP